MSCDNVIGNSGNIGFCSWDKVVDKSWNKVIRVGIKVYMRYGTMLILGMRKRSIFILLPLSLCSSNTSSYPTHQNVGSQSLPHT